MRTKIPFSEMTCEEYLAYLYSKKDPTDEDIESALRIELLFEENHSVLETVHQLAMQAITRGDMGSLRRIRDLTAPVVVSRQDTEQVQ